MDRELDGEARAVLGAAPDAVEPLAHATRTSVTRRVCRVRTRTGDAVVKVISSGRDDPGWSGSNEPSHARYWRREPMLYRDGLPGAYRAAGVRAPSLLAAFDRPDGVALWLESAGGEPGARWSPRTYEHAARRLANAQAPYLVGAAEPGTFPWSRDFLPQYLRTWDDVGWHRVHEDDAWQAPLVRSHFSARLRHELVALCEDRARMLSWATRLPQTICHHDVWPNNLFASEDHITLIDWAFAGHGHLGADVGNLITDSCGDLLQPSALLPELDAAATAGYQDGLREQGWHGDPRHVRLGICLMAAKWSWLTPHMLRLAHQVEHRVYGRTRVDPDHLFSERAATLAFNARLAAEARALAAELGM